MIFSKTDIISQLKQDLFLESAFIDINQEKSLVLLELPNNIYQSYSYSFDNANSLESYVMGDSSGVNFFSHIQADFPNASFGHNPKSIWESVRDSFQDSVQKLNESFKVSAAFDWEKNIDCTKSPTPIDLRTLKAGDEVFRSVHYENHETDSISYTKDTVTSVTIGGFKNQYLNIRFKKEADVYIRKNDLNDTGHTVCFLTAKELLEYINLTDLQ